MAEKYLYLRAIESIDSEWVLFFSFQVAPLQILLVRVLLPSETAKSVCISGVACPTEANVLAVFLPVFG